MKIALQSKNIVGSTFHKEGVLIIENGKIKDIVDKISPNEVDIYEDWGDSLIMPGLVDTHVHVNEPGRTDWEGFTTASSCCCWRHNNNCGYAPQLFTSNNYKKAFDTKLEAIVGKLYVDVGFGVGSP